MRTLILTLGSRGDVQPYVALAGALKARGHDVTVATSRGFEALIEAGGARAAPLSVDFQELLRAADINQALRSLRGKVKAFRASKDLMRQQLDDMWTIARDLQPNLIIYHPKAIVAPYLARALGGIAMPSFLQPAFTATGAFLNPLLPAGNLGRWLNRGANAGFLGLMRLGYGAVLRGWRSRWPTLNEGGRLDVLAGYHPDGRAVPRLHAYSRHLLPPTDDWADTERITGYWFSPPTPDWTPADALSRFLAEGPPPVYVGFGSMPSEDAGRLTRLVTDALDRVGRRGILATGWGGLQTGAVSDGRLHVLDAAPHDWLFPQCAAVVHHGGAGTTHEALRWGRPSVVCPVFGDQPFWGRRVASLGAGPPPVPQKTLTPEKLADALAMALRPETAGRARKAGVAIGAENGAENAAALIDTVATPASTPVFPPEPVAATSGRRDG